VLKNGGVWEHFGACLAHLGAVWAHFDIRTTTHKPLKSRFFAQKTTLMGKPNNPTASPEKNSSLL
jgi:hypothetical protein